MPLNNANVCNKFRNRRKIYFCVKAKFVFLFFFMLTKALLTSHNLELMFFNQNQKV